VTGRTRGAPLWGLVPAVAGALAVARLSTGWRPWVAAMAAAAVAWFVTVGAARRLPRAASPLAGVVAGALVALWVAVPAATWWGVPTPGTLGALDHALRVLGTLHPPVVGTAGAVFLAGLVAAVAASATAALPGAWRAAPALVVVTTSAVAIPSPGAAALVVVMVVAGAATTVVGRPDTSGLRVLAVSGLVVLSTSAAVGATAPPATSTASGGGPAVAGVPPTALSLVSRLTALVVRDPGLVLFSASSPVPTYWQIGSLTELRGQTWRPDPATAAALGGAPFRAGPPPVEGPPSLVVSVAIANLASRLLPVPPDTARVSTGRLSEVGAVLATPSHPGLTYGAEAVVPAVDGGAAGAPAPAAPADTALPPEPAAVIGIADAVTASASTPLGKAEALTNWFRSRRFRYSLTQRAPGLLAFLTTDRVGSCQQYAGAFAVLARAVGLPTRVALGFTPGRRDRSGRYVVRGVDAHAWPQVLIEGQWVSFEPTPVLPAGELAPPGVIGQSALGTPNPATTTPPAPRPVPVKAPAAVNPAGSPAPSPARWWPVGAAVFAVLVAGALGASRRRRGRSPADEVVAAWRRVDRTLARRGRPRPPSTSPQAHLSAMADAHAPAALVALWPDVEWLAARLAGVVYGDEVVDPATARRARHLSRQVRRSA
jgi:transglutaminase-like putative cysteine protease